MEVKRAQKPSHYGSPGSALKKTNAMYRPHLDVQRIGPARPKVVSLAEAPRLGSKGQPFDRTTQRKTNKRGGTVGAIWAHLVNKRKGGNPKTRQHGFLELACVWNYQHAALQKTITRDKKVCSGGPEDKTMPKPSFCTGTIF